jgi:hypothetical protein
MYDKGRDLGERKDLGLGAEEADDGCGGDGDGADGEAVDGGIVLGGVFEVGAVDEDVGHVVGDVEVENRGRAGYVGVELK